MGSNWFLPKIVLGSDDEIRLGAMAALSGPVAPFGTEQANGIKLAVDLYNESGGINGRKIKLLQEDTESKKDVGFAVTRRLVERDKVHFLTGVCLSSIVLAIQPYIKEKKTIFVNSNSGNDILVKPPHCNRYYFKELISAWTITLAIQEPAKRIGKKWYFLADNYTHGKEIVDHAKRSLKSAVPDAEIVGEDFPNLGESNYAPYLTKIMAAQPDGLFIGVIGAGYVRSIKQARQMGLNCHIHTFCWFHDLAKAIGDGIVGSSTAALYMPDNPEVPRARKIADEYKKRFGHWPGTMAGEGFNGVECIFEAVKKAGTTDTEPVIETMESMEYTNTILSPSFRFRKADHQAIRALYTAEVTKDPTFTYGLKILRYQPHPTEYLTPESETGCESHMKP